MIVFDRIRQLVKPPSLYTETVPSYGDVMTVEEWREYVKTGCFIDYDGHCRPIKDGRCMPMWFYPSEADELPADATHVVWFNR